MISVFVTTDLDNWAEETLSAFDNAGMAILGTWAQKSRVALIRLAREQLVELDAIATRNLYENLGRSILIELSESQGLAVIYLTQDEPGAVEYAVDLETGLGPHHVPLDNLITWAEAKGIVTNDVVQFATRVQAKIAAVGTSGKPYFTQALPGFETVVWALLEESVEEFFGSKLSVN